jgi:hypothetical protein
MENHVGMVSTGENFVHQSALAILPAESISSKVWKTGEENDELGILKYLCSYFEGIFNMP